MKLLIPALTLSVLVGSSVAGEIPAAKMALAEKTLAAMNMEENMKAGLQAARQGMASMSKSAFSGAGLDKHMTPEKLAELSKTQERTMKIVEEELSWEKIKPDYVKLYAEVYSEAELKAQIAFYTSPEGRSILDKTPILTQKTMQITQARMVTLMPKIMAEARKGLEEKKEAKAAQPAP